MASNEMHSVVKSCEVCGEANLKDVLNLGLHPMCDDLVEIGSDRVCKLYPIEILYCATCRTGHQRHQVPKQELFPKSYHYRSRFTADVLSGMASLVASCDERYGSLEGKLVLDIGCNDGSLLECFKQRGALTLGIEPTGAASDAKLLGHDVFADYLSEDLAREIVKAHGHPYIVTFTNVFAHIEDLPAVLRALEILKGSDTKIVIENHYLGAVLEGNQFDTFYHEHPRTYSYASFQRMSATLGLSLEAVEFPSRYGGNIRVFMGAGALEVDAKARELVEQAESTFEAQFEALNNNIQLWLTETKSKIEGLYWQYGKLRAKAFPGRSAILVKMLELDESMIECVYEKPGSLKIGHYVPGTRIPIKSDDELFAESDLSLPILNFAWHISAEIESYLRDNGYTGEVIPILSKDF